MLLRCEHYGIIDSTSSEIRRRVEEGSAEAGLVISADFQTAGRGRTGKSFESAEKLGIYFSMLLRFKGLPEADFAALTARSALVCCRALEKECGCELQVKWVNDIIARGRKLCGILTEMLPSEDPEAPYIIVGVGVNVNQQASDFSPELANLAASLSIECGRDFDIPTLRDALISGLAEAYSAYPAGRAEDLTEYRRRCVTLGKDIYLIREGVYRKVYASDIDESFGLICRAEDGSELTVNSGEISVRGMAGYI